MTSQEHPGSAHLKSSASRLRRSPGATAPDLFARYLDDLEVGDSFTTKGRTITEADLVNFAALTWDTYPLHVDAEWASKTMFGERIAHGMLVLSYAAGLVPMQPGPIVAFHGMEKVRFFAPTKIGDTIRVHVELKEKEERDEHIGLATFHQAVLNQRDETVCKFMTTVVLKRRGDA